MNDAPADTTLRDTLNDTRAAHRTKKRRLIVFTGAGISADSGIATFRDANGLWENYSIEEVCSEHTWKTNFDAVHRFYNARRQQLAAAQPNEAHHMLARLQKRYDAILITQNIDDLLERAGCENVVHVHGFLTEMYCDECSKRGKGAPWDIGYTAWKAGEQRCPSCLTRYVRPHVVFFGGNAPKYQIMYGLFEALTPDDILLVMGTAGQVVSLDGYTDIPTSILSNLESETPKPENAGMLFMDDNKFDHVLHGRASDRAIDIERLIDSLMEGA